MYSFNLKYFLWAYHLIKSHGRFRERCCEEGGGGAVFPDAQ